MRPIIPILSGLIVAGVGAGVLYGNLRWRHATANRVASLNANAQTAGQVFDAESMARLPEPVARYFRRALPDGQPVIRRVRLEQEGEFFAQGGWRPFRATQHFSADRPGFVWDARIFMAPFMPVYVRDAYAGGRAEMRGEILAMYPIVDQHDTQELAAGALMRYLGEAAWFPTALLPTCGVRWTAIDASRARATLTDRGTTVSLDVTFDESGDIVELFAPDRPREENGSYFPTPWRVRMLETAARDGIRIGVKSEVEWVLPEGPRPYWRGTITRIDYHT
jgi:Family of unknown function (DUF6544)